MRLIVMCPKCGNKQKMITNKGIEAVRKCVYCGRSFNVRKRVVGIF